MIKIILLIIFHVSIVLGNTNNYFGLGESRSMQDPAMLGMGGSWYFSGQTNGVSTGSSATFWRTKLSQLGSSFSFSTNKFENFPSQSVQSLNYIHFQFPVGKRKAIAFSLTPSTRVNYHINDRGLEDENILFNGEIIQTDLIYYGKGGITDLRISYSFEFENNLSFGIDWDIGFGSLLKRDTLIVNNIVVTDFNEFSYSNIYLDTYESRLLFRSNSFKINSLYDLDKLQISSSIAFDYELLIIENMNYFTNNNLYTGTEFLSTSSDSKKTNFNIRAFGVGFAYKLAKNSALNLEIHNNSGRLIPKKYQIFENSKESTSSLHLGFFKWIPSKSDFDILNTLVLRSGFYFERSRAFYDYGITLGIGLEYFNNTSMINLGCKLGSRNSESINLNNEVYSEFIISIVSSDKWFK